MNSENQEHQVECDSPPDSQFESFYDDNSGHWSLRRVPTAPPVALPDDS